MTGIDPLRAAVLDGDIELVTQLANRDPERLTEKGASGLSLVQLALAREDLPMVLALVRLGATCPSWTMTSDLLPQYLSFISGGYLAKWLTDIEYVTYQLMQGDAAPASWTYEVSKRDLDDLRLLSVRFDGWSRWETGGPRFVPMTEWEPMFRDWAKLQLRAATADFTPERAATLVREDRDSRATD